MKNLPMISPFMLNMRTLVVGLFALQGVAVFSQEIKNGLDVRVPKDPYPDKTGWVEDVSQRTPYSTTWNLPGGKIIVHNSKQPLNYYNKSGELVPVNTELKLKDGRFGAADQELPFYLEKNSSVNFQAGQKDFSFGKTISINGAPAAIPVIKTDKTQAILEHIIPNTNKIYTFYQHSVKYDYIVSAKPVITGQYYIIEEEISLPEGYNILPAQGMGENAAEGWKGHLTVTDGKDELAHFGAIVCYDQVKNITIGGYEIQQKNNSTFLRMKIPASWMKDPARVYPITIDPLVTGPTTTWTGGYMESCFSPQYNVDSILINVPAAITVTGLMVTSSYYADPFTGAWMADGQMYFSTDCNQTTTFTVAPPAGNTAGTAYLEDFNLKNPLMCCYPQSCNPYTFYLRMHLSRTALGTGCNTTYLYYYPFTAWPFSAYIEGNTPETYGAEVNIVPTTICSNTCSLTANVYARYGVPPYTFSHPWSTTVVTGGTAVGCGSGNTVKQLPLTIPDCPLYCDTSTVLNIPQPIVVDACGDTIDIWGAITVNIKPTPDVTSLPDSLSICSGSPFDIALSSCFPNAVISWNGGSGAGTGNIQDSLVNNSNTPALYMYAASATLNGCTSLTDSIAVTVYPKPQLAFSNNPDPAIILNQVSFTDNTTMNGNIPVGWSWNFGDGSFDFNQNPQHIYQEPGYYSVCLFVQTSSNCLDTFCKTVPVIPAELILPNVFTPNGDGTNEVLEFYYLDVFPENHLAIFNRWGNLVYETSNYKNDWNGGDNNEGIYYYVLTIPDFKEYAGFVHIIKD